MQHKTKQTFAKGWFPLRKTFLRTGKFPLSCELSVATNGSNAKETFLS